MAEISRTIKKEEDENETTKKKAHVSDALSHARSQHGSCSAR